MAANWTAFVAGNVLTAAQLNDVVDNFQDIAIFCEEQAQNTQGGSFNSGSWVKRTLNTTRVNNIGGCSISSSVITLATAGTYLINAIAPAFVVESHQLRFQNTTAATTSIVGQTNYTSNANFVTTYATLQGIVTVTTSTNFELQHRCKTTRATDGLGIAANLTTEVYSQLMIARIA